MKAYRITYTGGHADDVWVKAPDIREALNKAEKWIERAEDNKCEISKIEWRPHYERDN